jgi:hypothetical protein
MIMSETLTWSDPIETEKIRTHHAKIVVERTTGMPYYSIEWFDTSKQEYYLGYSSYNIENVLGWLSEYFEIVEKPMTNADRIRAMSDEELADLLLFGFEEDNISIVGGMRPIGHEEWMRTVDEVLKWLQQPVEVDNG